MTKSQPNRKHLSRIALGVLAGILLLTSGMVNFARAADEEDDTPWDTKILQQLLRGIGLRNGTERGIEYRERSPLVVPPNRNLTAPSKTAAEKNAAWPTDPEVKRRRDAKLADKNNRQSIDWNVESRPLKPSATSNSGPPTGSQVSPDNSQSDISDRPMKPSELGYKGGLWNGFYNSLFGGAKEEYTTFTGETPRASLIEPPSGYRTPSPYQPYGVGKDKWIAPTIDRHEAVR